jgi:NADPH:quinone reductase-like Zn-dependent oxidoreductase
MKAVIIRGYGGPDVIELADVPVPQPGTGQVRIRVHAAPVHPVDSPPALASSPSTT